MDYPGLLMTSKVFGFHGDITEGDGTNPTLGDFTSYLDHSGSFYLGGGESGHLHRLRVFRLEQ